MELSQQERLKLNAELAALNEFLKSPAYSAGLSVVQSCLDEATELIYSLSPTDPAYNAKIMQAIGEGRAYRNWKQPFIDRLEELKEALGTPLEEEKQN